MKMGDPGLACLRHQCLAERLNGIALMGIEKPEGDVTRLASPGAMMTSSSTYRESQRTQGRAFDKSTSADVRHRHLLPEWSFCFSRRLKNLRHYWGSADPESRGSADKSRHSSNDICFRTGLRRSSTTRLDSRHG